MVVTWLKKIATSLLGLAAGLLCVFIVYDLLEFEPRRAEIQALLARALPLEQAPPSLLPDLQRADARDQLARRATHLLLEELDREAPRMQTLARLRREFLWEPLVEIHLSEDQQLLIERSRVFLGQRTLGFERGALSVFGRTLDGLTDHELAELVVIARWPTRYRYPESSVYVAKAASALLDEVRTARQR